MGAEHGPTDGEDVVSARPDALTGTVDGDASEPLGSMAPAEGLGELARDVAAERFRQAMVEMAGESPAPDAAERAAQAVLDLADQGADVSLREFLAPDPDSSASAWSVACYELGSLTPASIHEFEAPAEACRLFRDCTDRGHAAAELVASDDGGTQWVAMARTLHRHRFQLPSDATCRPAPTADPKTLDGAVGRWARRISAWESDLAEAAVVDVPGLASDRRPSGPLGESAPSPSPSPAQLTSSAVRSAIADSLPHLEEGVAAALIACESLSHVIADGVVSRLRVREESLDEAGKLLVTAREGLRSIEAAAGTGDPPEPEQVARVRRAIEAAAERLRPETDPVVGPAE